MRMSISNALALFLIGAMFICAGVALEALPPGAQVANHFDAAGRADGWADAGFALFEMPVLGTLFWFGRRLLPKLDPRGENLRRSADAVDTICVAALFALASGQILIVSQPLGWTLDGGMLMPIGLGAVFILIGNVFGKLRWNHTVGIRTPWTIANERVWDKTHRLGGWCFVIGGFCLIFAALMVPARTSVILPAVLVATIGIPFAASYLYWRRVKS